MPFEEGNTRSVGRPLGSKNKLTKEFLAVYEEAKNKFAHPFTTMMEWAHDENKPIEIRAAMLKECASYVCPKPRQHHSVELDIPVFKSIEQAETWIAALPAALGEELDTTEILSMISSWISSRREGEELELKIKASGQ